MSDTLNIFSEVFTGVTGIKAKDNVGNTLTYIRPQGQLPINANGLIDVTQYASVDVNVAQNLQAKVENYTPTTSTQTDSITADSGYDGLSYVGVTVNPIPSEYIIPSGSQTITENGTYDVSALASAVVAVSGGGSSSIQYATGTWTPSQTYNTTGNRAIVTIAEIGFTPTRFILRATANGEATASGTQYAVFYAIYDSAWPLRISVRYTNTSNTSGASPSQAAWTTQTNNHLYTNGTTVYFRTTSTYLIPGNVQYVWEAYA